jgi:hypothetical protein
MCLFSFCSQRNDIGETRGLVPAPATVVFENNHFFKVRNILIHIHSGTQNARYVRDN